MSRLIDADKLVKKALERDGVLSLKVEDIKSICGIPIEEIIVDAEPIRHGHWVVITKEDSDGWCVIKCTNCGFFLPYLSSRKEIEEEDINYYYCPICGAKMDEVEEDDL